MRNNVPQLRGAAPEACRRAGGEGSSTVLIEEVSTVQPASTDSLRSAWTPETGGVASMLGCVGFTLVQWSSGYRRERTMFEPRQRPWIDDKTRFRASIFHLVSLTA